MLFDTYWIRTRIGHILLTNTYWMLDIQALYGTLLPYMVDRCVREGGGRRVSYAIANWGCLSSNVLSGTLICYVTLFMFLRRRLRCLCSVYTVHSVYSVHNTVEKCTWSVHCILSIPCTLYSVQIYVECSLYTQYTVYIV